MGRYLTIDGDMDYKFSFGNQDSDDILTFGYQCEGIYGCIEYDNLKKIEKDIKNCKVKFKKDFKMTYESYEKLNVNTLLDKNKNIEREASHIRLGVHIIKKLKEKKSDLDFYAEV